jgi:hypothetical protein
MRITPTVAAGLWCLFVSATAVYEGGQATNPAAFTDVAPLIDTSAPGQMMTGRSSARTPEAAPQTNAHSATTPLPLAHLSVR